MRMCIGMKILRKFPGLLLVVIMIIMVIYLVKLHTVTIHQDGTSLIYGNNIMTLYHLYLKPN